MSTDRDDRVGPVAVLRDWFAIAASFALTLEVVLVAIVVVSMLAPGWRSVAVMSGSMEPVLDIGDVVLIKESADLGADVVVLVDRGDDTAPLLHRVVGWEDENTMITRGDANASNDSTPVTVDQVIGVGRVAIPAIGLPMVWLHEADHVQLAAVVIANLVLIAAAVGGTRRERASGPAVGGFVPVSDHHLAALRVGLPPWVGWPPDERAGGP